MRSIAAVLLVLAFPSAAHAITPEGARATDRLPGIAEGPPRTTRVPGVIQVRVVDYDPVVAHDLHEARRSIERRRENGELSWREARRLRREVRLIARTAHRYGQDGLTADERRELALRADVVRARSEAPRLATR